MDPFKHYFEFFETQDEAIEHCRRRNRGLSSKDPGCCAVVPGPGCANEEHPSDCACCDHAVVDFLAVAITVAAPRCSFVCHVSALYWMRYVRLEGRL